MTVQPAASGVIQSTVPGAILAVEGYMLAIQATYPEMAIGVYAWGMPTGIENQTYLGLGDWDTGGVVSAVGSDWNAIPAYAALIKEEYALQGVIRTSGNAGGPLAAKARTTDAFTLWSAFVQQVVSDPSGGGNLTPSGSWGALELTTHFSGPNGAAGWEVTLGFSLHVVNAQLTG